MSKSDSSVISSTDEMIRSLIADVIETELKSSNFVFDIESASKAGTNNFIGIVFRIVYKKYGETEDEERSLIFKFAPQSVARRNQFRARLCFLREILMYDEILPYFRHFEQSKGVTGKGETFTEYPKCFRTVDKEFNECIVLEDMKVRGFIPIDRHTEEMNCHHIHLYMQALAKYHAISLAIKDQQSEKFENLTSNMKDVMFQRDNESFRIFFQELMQYILSLFSADADAHLLGKLKQFFDRDVLDIFLDIIELEAVDPAAVISYGDSNMNNSLFRYDNNKKPIEICLLDWQASRLASPMYDVFYYLFSNVTKNVRDVHYDSFLDDYHKHLSAHLQRLGSNPEKLFPYELMKQHLKTYGKVAIILAAMVLPVLTSEPGDSVDLDALAEGVATGNDTFTSITAKYGSKFDQRMRDVVKDVVQLGYI